MSELTDTPKKKASAVSKSKPKDSVGSTGTAEKQTSNAKPGTASSKVSAAKADVGLSPAPVSKTTMKASKSDADINKVESAVEEKNSVTAGKGAKARAQIANADIKERASKGTVRRTKATETEGTPRTGQAKLPDQTTIDSMVAEAAYYLAEKRNFATGFEEEDWLAAKEQIMSQLQGAKKPKS